MIHNQWYMICPERELRRQGVLRRTVVGREVVAFRAESGRVSVLEDRCCHRNVHLSLGYVQGECLKCGYHGWEYGSDGRCVHIPSLEAGRSIPATARVKAYPTEVRHRLVWAWFGDGPADTGKIPPLGVLDDFPFTINYHEVRGDLKLIAESLFDAQHINHVHRDSIQTMMGNLQNEPVDFHLEATADSLRGWYYRKNRRNLFEKIYFGFNPEIETHFGFWFPHTSMLDLRFPVHGPFPSRRMVIFEHFYQMDVDRCMMIQITAWERIFRYNPWFARWFMARKSNRIVEEDIAFLESNRAWKRKNPELRDLFVPADELTFAFNKIWNEQTHDTESPH